MHSGHFKFKQENGKEYIYDANRRKYVALTAEEWVRQHALYHLMHMLHYPKAVISVEKQIKVGSRNRRYDIVVYKESIPWLIVECKSEKEILNEQVLSQLLSYNSTLNVSYLTITNGTHIMTYDIAEQVWKNEFPVYG